MPLTDEVSCTLSSLVNIETPSSCVTNANVITITNAFPTEAYNPNTNTFFEFVLSSTGTNPPTAIDAGFFQVEIYQFISGDLTLIDSYN